MSNVCVVGAGHVGLVVAAGLAELGHRVRAVDVDARLVDRLNDGEVDIEEPGLIEQVADGVMNGKLTFGTVYASALADAEYVFLCVDTPQTIAGAADLSRIRSACRSIAEVVNGSSPIIVIKSTSPIGTGETIEDLLRASLPSPRIVSNPEFLRQGHGVMDFRAPDRIVVGSRSSMDALAVASLYRANCPVIVTDTRTAEMTKYVANAFLATRVSFVNEVARLCDVLSTDVDTIVEGIASDPRIGRAMFTPGIGYGGSCLPKDVAALRYAGEVMGAPTPLLSAVESVNDSAKRTMVRRIRLAMNGLEGKRVVVWGLTFKGGTEDVRQSPAVDVARMLVNEGAHVVAFDPSVDEFDGLEVAFGMYSDLGDAEALVVLTDHAVFRTAAWDMVAAAMVDGAWVFDGRNVLNPTTITEAGLTYVGTGRSARC
jgi:UDPglucose 6-dehydrogenase